MNITLEEVEKYLKENYDEEQICDLVDDVKGDYLHHDWESEYEDEHEAYLETGGGEAEGHVRRDIETDLFRKFYPNFAHVSDEQRRLLYAMYSESAGEEMWETINRIFENLDVN